MRKSVGMVTGLVVLVGLAASVVAVPRAPECCADKPAAAADAPKPGEADPADAAPADGAAPACANGSCSPIADAAFDQYFDVAKFGAAWYTMSPEMLTDCALGLAEAERVFQRTHKSGLTAARLFKLSVKMAIETRNTASLDRLGAAAAARKDGDLATLIDAAKKVAGQSRAIDPASKFSVDDLTASQFEAIKSAVDGIRQAKVLGDAEGLKAIEAELADTTEFGPAEKAYLGRMAKDSQEGSRDVAEGEDPTKALLATLSAGSRESNRDQVRANVSAGGWHVVWGVELNEGEYLKFVASVAASIITANPGFVQAYFQDYLDRTYTKFAGSLPGVAKKAFLETAVKAMKDRGRTFNINRVGIRAGIATYQNWNDITFKEPRTTIGRQCTGPNWARVCVNVPQITFVTVTKRVPGPNKHQPYFAFRTY